MKIKLDDHMWSSEPFEHAVFRQVFTNEMHDDLVSWLEEAEGWQEQMVPDFYRLDSIKLTPETLPAKHGWLLGYDTLTHIRTIIGKIFGATFKEDCDLSVHRLSAGDRIGIHTDYGETNQTHRLLVQFNRGWSASQGGALMLLDSERPDRVSKAHRYYVPRPSSGVAFRISPRSYHAVGVVWRGTRHTLCYSFQIK